MPQKSLSNVKVLGFNTVIQCFTRPGYLISRILGQEVGADVDAIAVLSSTHLAHGVPGGRGIFRCEDKQNRSANEGRDRLYL